jgi:hypothetical protein
MLVFAAPGWAQLWSSLFGGGSEIGIWRRGSLEGQKGRFLNARMVTATLRQGHCHGSSFVALCRKPASNYSSLFQCSYIHAIKRQTFLSSSPPLPSLQSTLRCLSPERFSQTDPSIASYKVSKTDANLIELFQMSWKVKYTLKLFLCVLTLQAAGTKDAWHRVLYLASHPFEDVASHLSPGMQPS